MPHSAQTHDMENEKNVDRKIWSEETTGKAVIDLKNGAKIVWKVVRFVISVVFIINYIRVCTLV